MLDLTLQVVNVDFYIKSVCKTGEDDDNEALLLHCVSGWWGEVLVRSVRIKKGGLRSTTLFRSRPYA